MSTLTTDLTNAFAAMVDPYFRSPSGSPVGSWRRVAEAAPTLTGRVAVTRDDLDRVATVAITVPGESAVYVGVYQYPDSANRVPRVAVTRKSLVRS